jgi:phage gpG-like protein
VPVARSGGEFWSFPSGKEKGAAFVIDWHGDAGEILKKASERLENFGPMLDLIGRVVKGYSKRSFAQQADPVTGDPWAPLKRMRPKGHNQNPIVLFDTGALYGSVDYRVMTDAVWIGWEPKYGVFHQKGAPAANIPQRRFIGYPPDALAPTLQEWAARIFAP